MHDLKKKKERKKEIHFEIKNQIYNSEIKKAEYLLIRPELNKESQETL